MSLDLTTFAAGLKTVYTRQRIETMTYRNNPFLAMVRKMENMTGDGYKVPVVYGAPQSRSATFSTAQTLSSSKSIGIKAFTVTRVRDYGVVQIDHETMLASKDNPGAFMQARVAEIDGAINAVTQSLATACYRSGQGAIGQVNATAASTTLTLKNAEDIVNFEPGMVLDIGATETAAVRTAQTSPAPIVNAVNRSAGTITLNQTQTAAWSAIAADDYIFVKGDHSDSGTITKVAGMEAWCPASAPASTAFYGVDRTTDSRLGGLRLDGSSYTVEEALVKASVTAAKEGATPDHVFISYAKFADLVNSLGAKAMYADLKVGEIGFQALRLYAPGGELKIVPDRNCPSNRAFVTQLDTWELGSIGQAVGILNYEGLEGARVYNADSLEVRVGFYGNLICRAPGWTVNVQL
jgi:hypothetical protein